MSSRNYESARSRFQDSAKLAIKEYIKIIAKDVSEEYSTDKLKAFIEAKVEAVEGCKEALRAIQSDVTQKYMRDTVKKLMDAMWDAYEITLEGLEDTIESSIADNRVKASVQGKRKSFENSKILIDSIKEIEELIEGDVITIKESKSFKKKTIESRAKNV